MTSLSRTICSLVCTAACSVGFGQADRLVIISWDGAADWVVDRLLAEGRLPNVRKMREKGAFADSVIVSTPSKTAVGHSLFWTGAYPSVSNITGNSVPALPKSEHAITETRSGFSSFSLAAEPVWISALRIGKRVSLLSATQSYPPDPWVSQIRTWPNGEAALSRFTSYSGFESKLYDAKVYTDTRTLRATTLDGSAGMAFEFTVGAERFTAFFPQEAGTYTECRVYRLTTIGQERIALLDIKSNQFSIPIKVTKGSDFGLMSFGLLELSDDLSHFMFYQGSASAIKGHFSKEDGELYTYALGPFHDMPIFDLYAEGKLGKTYWMGGNGDAEKHILKLIALDYDRLGRAFKFAVQNERANLITVYSPATDSMGHVLIGVLDPSSPKYNEGLASKLWPVYAATYEYADRWLGEVIEAAGPNAIVALVSDHGMEGTSRLVNVNRILVDAGLAIGGERGVDPSRSRVFCPSWADFFVCVHTDDWKNGIVPTDQKDALIKQAIHALLSYRDPKTGLSPIVRAIPASEVLGAGGSAGGDIYLEFAPGYYPVGGLGRDAVWDDPSAIGDGSHGFLPGRKSMRAVFYAIGRGVSGVGSLGDIQAVDVIATLAPLAGIPVPKDCVGRSLIRGNQQ